ncbi:MAG: DNA methyltransferase Dim-2 [Piccolia ochrophora]|nr:MAG: DNA methyltransferase Dim-2 [Piccolia ochrophora]
MSSTTERENLWSYQSEGDESASSLDLQSSSHLLSESPQRPNLGDLPQSSPYLAPTPSLRSRKRKRSQESLQDSHQNSVTHEESDCGSARARDGLPFSGIRLPSFVFPKSSYLGWTPPLPRSSEADIYKGQPTGCKANYEAEEFCCIQLNDFRVYRKSVGKHPHELAPLHHLCCKEGHDSCLFDGVLDDGQKCYYVQAVPFELLSIGGYYDDQVHRVHQTWIQSKLGINHETWYQLGSPASDYAHYHDQFLWLASLAKHVVDFLGIHHGVCLKDFQETFFAHTEAVHGHDLQFQGWFAGYGDRDFRRAIAANAHFLYKEAVNVEATNATLSLWTEIMPGSLSAVEEQTLRHRATTVTPIVYDCFKHMPWARYLNAVEIPDEVVRHRRRQENALHLTTNGSWSGADPTKGLRHKLANGRPTSISIGDVVGVSRDAKTRWKDTAAVWFAYVQGFTKSLRGERALSVIWLYRPSDTTCSTMHYPIPNELFFSDNCNCGSARLYARDVVCSVSVDFFVEPGGSNAEYFVRQKYRHDAAFVTLKPSDLKCMHEDGNWKSEIEEVTQKYRPGDTILYSQGLPGDDHILEPAEYLGVQEDGISEQVWIRKLLRRSRDFMEETSSRPNELVYTNERHAIKAKDVERGCHVRFFTDEEKARGEIPVPYNRDGNGDAYFITSRLVSDSREQRLEPLERPFPSTLIQGFDPGQSSCIPTLKGLDLFCGGGSFGRGLEEAGPIQNKWAVDYDCNAIHTYRANLRSPDDTSLYHGSVNDFLASAIKGQFSRYIPRPGEVDFISAGSPCQGFSLSNPNKASEKALRNCSLIASVAAFLDLYRPKYALLENVVSMAKKMRKTGEQDVFSQLLCALVGMGYQVQSFNLDAWSFGSPQSRSRLFISIAAPGLHLPPHPALSHSHPENKTDRGLGVAANQEPFGIRRFDTTPFSYVTIQEAMGGLPNIGNGRTQTCIPYPDHRFSRIESTLRRTLISHIPVYPRGQTYISAFKRGYLADDELDEERGSPWSNRHRLMNGSKAYGRIDPNGLHPTICTAIHPACAFTGTSLHWEQHRLVTVMEARRVQGFPDHEVLLGRPAAQWKIIGNSVCRPVALALGMSLREAWLANAEMGVGNVEGENTTINAEEAIKGVIKEGSREIITIDDDEDDDDQDLIPYTPRPRGLKYSETPDWKVSRDEDDADHLLASFVDAICGYALGASVD